MYSAHQQKAPIPVQSSTETTRYLCAAAHLDSTFRQYVLEHVVREEHRAVVVSYGVDVTSVVRYCLAAQRRELKRDLILLALFILAIPLLAIWPLIFLAAWIVVGYEMWARYYGNVAAGLAKGKFHPQNLQFPLDPSLENKLGIFSSTQNNNAVVYSGYSPFVGMGSNLNAWSFAIDTSKGKTEHGAQLSPSVFQVSELYRQLQQDVTNLGIKGLKIEDKIFVNGQDIRDDKRFLANPYARPYTQVDPRLVGEISEHPTQDIRHYQCIQITSWSGELILSIFLRFSKAGKNLFVEANYSLLKPVHEAYRRIDNVEASFTLRKFLEVAGKALLPAVFLWIFSPFILWGRIMSAWDRTIKKSRKHREISENPAFDYGAVSSLREAASSRNYHRHFQYLDKEMYVKIIEKQILESIIEFLDAKNIDITDLRERQEVILNHGVIVSGGQFKAENVAIGDRAKSFVNNFMGGKPKASDAA